MSAPKTVSQIEANILLMIQQEVYYLEPKSRLQRREALERLNLWLSHIILSMVVREYTREVIVVWFMVRCFE